MSSALIVQNKGGGHGEIGFQLAKTLQSNPKISSITILQDDDYDRESEPFISYVTDIPDVSVIEAPLTNTKYMEVNVAGLQGVLGGRDARFDYIFDNYSKGVEDWSGPILECAKNWGVKLYTYVSSAGMYKPPPEGPFPMPETSPVKESAGQKRLESAAVEFGLPLVSFRPQYIYGEKANKFDYLDYYFDRIVRGLPIPIPGDGTQLVSLTNSEDVASLLASPLNNEEAAVQQRVFNCGTDQLVSYDEVAYICADAAGIPRQEVQIVHFDADQLGKGKFPFRPTNFYVAPEMAKQKLGWAGPTHNLRDDTEWYYEGYKARGGLEKEISLVKDWDIVSGSKTQLPDNAQSIYERFDPLAVKPAELEDPQ